MHDALAMQSVPMDATPHGSHRMGSKSSTLVSCASDDRFGTVRACLDCDAEEVFAGGAGSHYFDDELLAPCVVKNNGDD